MAIPDIKKKLETLNKKQAKAIMLKQQLTEQLNFFLDKKLGGDAGDAGVDIEISKIKDKMNIVARDILKNHKQKFIYEYLLEKHKLNILLKELDSITSHKSHYHLYKETQALKSKLDTIGLICSSYKHDIENFY